MLEILNKLYEDLILIIPSIITILIMIYKLIKNKRLKEVFQTLLTLKDITKVNMYIAEEFTHYSGEDKKEWVKTKVNQYCIDNKIRYVDAEVDRIVEELIELSNTVNKRETKEKEKLIWKEKKILK